MKSDCTKNSVAPFWHVEYERQLRDIYAQHRAEMLAIIDAKIAGYRVGTLVEVTKILSTRSIDADTKKRH